MKFEASTKLPTECGTFNVMIYRNNHNQEVTAICSGHLTDRENLPVRVHSACFTAETLGSLKCDCKQQLDLAMSFIAKNDGIVLYLPQEGRGIGLSNKIRAYALQEKGFDTIEANDMLGLPIDDRTYEDARDILNHLKVNSIKLMTNNPHKIENLKELGIQVNGRIPVACAANKHSADYLDTKQKSMGHMIKAKKQYNAPLKFPQNRAIKRPLIHVNCALDSSGLSASQNGQPLLLSCQKDWQRVHELREKYDAIAVGAKTWLNDSPQLTARDKILGREPVRQPCRVIFTGKQPCTIDNDRHRQTFVIGNNTHNAAHHINSHDHNLTTPLSVLNQNGVQSMLVEGGLQLITSFVEQNMIDLLTVFVRSSCYSTAIAAAQKAIPDLIADQIEAQNYGRGTLLSIAFNKAIVNRPELGIAI